MKEKIQKIMNKKLILSIIGACFIIIIITISVVNRHYKNKTITNNYSQNQITKALEKYKNIEEINNNNDKIENYKKIYDSNSNEQFNKTIELKDITLLENSNSYDITVYLDKKDILVNDKKVFHSNDDIVSIYLLNDLIILNTTSTIDNLIAVNIENENIKTIASTENKLLIDAIDNNGIIYSIIENTYLIYPTEIIDFYEIKYLGNSEFSSPTTPYVWYNYSSCIKGNYHKYCMIYNNDNLKLELIHNDRLMNLQINGKKVINDFYSINKVKLFDDKYLYIDIATDDISYDRKFLILDLNGNVITDSDNYFHNMGMSGFLLENNMITASTTALVDGLILNCQCMKENNLKYDDIINAKYSYKYIGNGKIEEINHTKETFREELIEYTGYDNCEQVLDEWKTTGNTFQTKR